MPERDFFYDEVRDGFYIPGMMKRAWGAALQILSEIHRICKKHGIRYIAGGGTLLGLVREKGFIPWDDDIDLFMLREDYKHFMEVADTELPEELSLDCIERNDGFRGLNPAIRLKSIFTKPELLRKYHFFPYPAFVDIFPLDVLMEKSVEEKRKRMVKANFSLMGEIERYGQTEENRKRVKEVLQKFHIPLNRERELEGQLLALNEEIYQLFNAEEGVGLVSYSYYYLLLSGVYPRGSLEDIQEESFYGENICIPKNFEALLRADYGDYGKKVKAGGAHAYPFYKEQVKKLHEVFGKDFFKDYAFRKEDLQREAVPNLRKLILNFVKDLSHGRERIFQELTGETQGLDAPAFLSAMQEESVALGNLIEERKGKGTKTVFRLEEFCEALYRMSLSFSVEELEKLDAVLKELSNAVAEDFKPAVVFLVHRFRYFEGFRPLIDALLQRGDVEVSVMPIPYYEKSWDGSILEEHYEGEIFAKEYAITDYRKFDFGAALPDAIVLSTPYDDYNPVWSVDPFFYSENMQRFTNRLMYIPWFITDEIDLQNPEDGKAFYQMNSYVTMPLVFRADLTIVQSEEMRKAYLAKIRLYLQDSPECKECEQEEILDLLAKKISGAGSCLYKGEERSGTEAVLEKFLTFLFE